MSDKNENKKNGVLMDEGKRLSANDLENVTGGVGVGVVEIDDEPLMSSNKRKRRPRKIDS